jgi:signal peptidase I
MSKKFRFILLSAVILVLMIMNPYKIIVVRGNSMYPTLKNGSILIGKKSDHFNRGDIVVARNDAEEIIIKRIKYISGDYYYYSYDRNTGEARLEEDSSYPRINYIMNVEHATLLQMKVPINQYYILGDNREISDDSRRFGTITKESIIYKIVK